MNCYLVLESDGITLIDTAMGAARIIIEAARHFGKPIRRILLTHSHLDHVGSLDALRSRLPAVQVVAGTREAQLWAEAARGVKPRNMSLIQGEPQAPVKGSFKRLRTPPDMLVAENDVIGSLRVISTPGHTPGHLAFLDERDATLYAGDSLTTFQELRLPFDPCWYFPFTHTGTWHDETALSSARKLLSFQLKRVLSGHGPQVHEPSAGLRRAIDRAQNKLGS